MKKVFGIVVLAAVIIFFGFQSIKQKVSQDLARPIPYPTITPKPPTPTDDVTNVSEAASLFVPYWTVKPGDTLVTNDYKQFIYFGIAPTRYGINTKDAGAAQIDNFTSFVPKDSATLLVLRMIEPGVNSAVLKSADSRKKIIAQTISYAKENNFRGIVLDLEMSAIPFDSLVNQITAFTTDFSKEAKKNNLTFSITMYGDVFYRIRPFDVKAIAKEVDSIMIMAYDFSKSKADPGPNFPLHGQETYGYDMTKLVDDLSRVVSPKKITIVFGLFGYDWLVNNQEKAIQPGKAVSTLEIEKNYINNCVGKNCIVSRDTDATETEIHYIDSKGAKHIIWFEDMDSVSQKKEYLKRRGITSFSFWANGYF